MTARTKLQILLGLGVCAVALMYRRRRHSVGTQPPPSRSRGVRGPMTQALVSANPADATLYPPGQNMEQRLDEAIQETFPASDPIALHIE